jgi:hypothetical protein
MGSAQLVAETLYLREFFGEQDSEIAFSQTAETSMRKEGITLPEVHHVLRRGRVVRSEDEGAKWVVHGSTCDDERLSIDIEVCWDSAQMCILDVIKVVRGS